MNSSTPIRNQPVPISPVLLAGFLARPLPLAGLQPFLRLAMQNIKNRHAEVFQRLAENGDMVFLIDPVDLPFAFELELKSAAPSLRAIEKPETLPEAMNAAIRGPLLALLALIEGRVDGDALFFSRELMIEGDTEAVVALRNAVDGAEINIIEDLAGTIPVFSKPALAALSKAQSVFTHMTQDLGILTGSLRAPLDRKIRSQAKEIKRQNERIDELAQALKRQQRSKS